MGGQEYVMYQRELQYIRRTFWERHRDHLYYSQLSNGRDRLRANDVWEEEEYDMDEYYVDYRFKKSVTEESDREEYN